VLEVELIETVLTAVVVAVALAEKEISQVFLLLLQVILSQLVVVDLEVPTKVDLEVMEAILLE
tara:strand:- start:474 stop:662 length:189 start_codon:yes stop_codon:yes gene_type:complete